MVFKCFDWMTGGRVSGIVNQEAKLCGDDFPSARSEDKVERFCEDYKDFIDVQHSYDKFEYYWEHVKHRAGDTLEQKRKFPLLLRALMDSFSGDLWKAFFAKLTWSILVIFSIAFFVFQILDFIKQRSNGTVTQPMVNYEIWLCAGFFLCMFVLSIGIQQMGIYSSILGLKVKAALTTAIYQKMIIRDGYESKADVVSLVAKDVDKLAEACLSLQYLWSGIFETVAVFATVMVMMGPLPMLPGVIVMCIFLPGQYLMGMVVAVRKKELAVVSSTRTNLMEEIMRGIKLIKIYGWEASFFKNLNEIRKKEGELEMKINVIKATILGLIFCLPPLLSLTIFGVQEATGEIESVLVFTALSFFNTLRVPFSKLPKSLRDVLDAFSCLERIQNFLLEPELADADATREVGLLSHQGIHFNDATLSYGENGKVVLANVNLDVPQGSLMMVAGPVASGKSNLLKSILGDLTLQGGSVSVSPSKAYVPQTPWTCLGTVRENIVFGKPFDEEFYHKVLHACALEPDLQIMADGDQTWIGERGGNLSGGQKQRIALARAAYSRAELYVLDSPLSAVDMYTCQHIFQYCIQDLMIAGGGTVVLATHQTELFKKSDHLVVMSGGKLEFNAKYTYNGVKHLFPSFTGDAEDDESEEHQAKVKQQSNSMPSCPKPRKKHHKMAMLPKKQKTRAKSILVVKENKSSIYWWYIQQMGSHRFAIATLIFICGQIMRVYSDYWITVWTKRLYEPEHTSDAFYAGIYCLLVMVFLCFSFARSFYWLACGKVAANKLHDITFAATLKAPMHFFHVTPIGQLLSFFTKDVDTIDDVLVDNTVMLQIFFWVVILAIGVVAYNMPLFLAIVAGLTVMYVYVCRTFIKTCMPLKKNAFSASSAVVAHTAETLSGLAVVRAFDVQEKFLEDNIRFQTRSTVVSFSIANLSLWLAYRVDILGSLLVLGCCLLAVLDASIDAGDAGLIVSNSFQILLFFSIMSRTMGEVHDNMTAVEGARTMSTLEEEKEPEVEQPTKEQWPSNGMIKFDGVVMPYLPGKPPVLKGISFNISAGEKIGVVGRTGAGKSSLIVALYRLAEIKEGRITVDDVDCSMVNLNKLRSSMAIIPQEPVMFGGTIRTNLDPFNQHEDDKLYEVLYKCLLGPVIEASKDGLNSKVEIMGSNFSLGTQQLMCLARAMLNPSKILLLDEATAALDSDTNAAVNQVLKEHFSDRTIFTIAHRLDTIIDSDKILTMNAGVVHEFDSPAALLNDPNSIFHELCMNAGSAQFEALRAKANARVSVRAGFEEATA